MTSSTSSSSSRRRTAFLLAGAILLGCAGHGRAVAPARPAFRVALFPLQNLSGAAIPTRGLLVDLDRRLGAAGLEVVSGALVDRFLAAHRIRYTGGVDNEVARAAREDLGVEGILITSIELYGTSSPPRFAATMRLVSTDDEPRLLWIDGTGRTGDDHPGILGLGLVSSIRVLEPSELERLTSSLRDYLDGRTGIPHGCPPDWRFYPRIAFRSGSFDPGQPLTVAVLPFMNETSRRSSGEVVALHLMRQLAAVPNLRVIDPGLVRDRLLRYRIIMEGGVSLDTARVMLTTLNADLVLAGYVRDYEDAAGAFGAPRVNFSALLLERRTERVVWEFSSHNSGDDSVFFFDVGRISTANALTCRMARDAVDDLLGVRYGMPHRVRRPSGPVLPPQVPAQPTAPPEPGNSATPGERAPEPPGQAGPARP